MEAAQVQNQTDDKQEIVFWVRDDNDYQNEYKAVVRGKYKDTAIYHTEFGPSDNALFTIDCEVTDPALLLAFVEVYESAHGEGYRKGMSAAREEVRDALGLSTYDIRKELGL